MIFIPLTLLSLLFWIFICFCLSKRWHLSFSLLCTTIMIPMHYKNRPTIIRKIIDNFDEITSADAMRVGLWLLGEYCDSRDASVSERVYVFARIMRECICGSCVSTALYSSMYPDFFIYPPLFPLRLLNTDVTLKVTFIPMNRVWVNHNEFPALNQTLYIC